ncbi:MAG: hypothetical protein WCK09_14280 [Bacteroidota bacterium]
MKSKDDKANRPEHHPGSDEPQNLLGYPLYPPGEDIYSKSQKVADIDPEDISRIKDLDENEDVGRRKETDVHHLATTSDLDVPGAELDDEQEKIGNEDEENNYYSLGSDNHNDLDEDNV